MAVEATLHLGAKGTKGGMWQCMLRHHGTDRTPVQIPNAAHVGGPFISSKWLMLVCEKESLMEYYQGESHLGVIPHTQT